MKRNYFYLLIAVMALLLNSCTYNAMVTKQENVNSAWGNVENVYQRRSDLIPNLVSTVKGYATHEEKTLTEVIEARSKATQITITADDLTDDALKNYASAQSGISSALGKLMAISEAYPELKANKNFLELQSQLEGTENRISVERKKYNDAVKEYNGYIRQFPMVIYSSLFGFDKKPYFEASAEAKTAPKVNFD